ncbi:MAG: ATP-binding protein [Cognatishimia sp.]
MQGKRTKFIWMLSYLFSALLVFFISTVAWYFFEKQRLSEEHMQGRAMLQRDLDGAVANLEAAISRNTDLIKAVAAVLAVEPNIPQERFEQLVKQIFSERPEVKNVAAAPNLVIKYMYPLEGNEPAVGLNYRNVPAQYEAVKHAMNAPDVVIAGPVNLVQGGVGLIARKAVYSVHPVTRETQFWGIISLVIDYDRLWADLGIPDLPFTFALRGKDGLGATGELIYWESRVFGQSPVTARVDLPEGSWWAAAIPTGGWQGPTQLMWNIRFSFLLGAIVVTLLNWGGLRLMQLRMKAVALLSSAINSIDDGFALYDADDRLITCNAKYREFYSLTADMFIPGNKFGDIMRVGVDRGQYPDAKGREEEFLQERMEAHRAADTVFEQKLVDGRWVKVAESRTPDGGTAGFRVDITELKNAKETAERANLAKTEFLDVMSHELRTPLTVVLGGTPFLCRPELLPASRKLLATLEARGEEVEDIKHDVDATLESLKTLAGKVERSAKHLLSLINDVLDFSKIEAGRMDVDFDDIRADVIVEELLEEFSLKASEKSLTLEYDVAPQLIRADTTRLRQVLINVLGNAIKFTETGGVRVSSDVVGGFLRFDVTDTGSGIPEDRLEEVFDKFTQLDSSSRRKAGGTGLGMAISKRIVEMQGGEISVKSKVGVGSTFSFTVPLARSQNQAEEMVA